MCRSASDALKAFDILGDSGLAGYLCCEAETTAVGDNGGRGGLSKPLEILLIVVPVTRFVTVVASGLAIGNCLVLQVVSTESERELVDDDDGDGGATDADIAVDFS